MIIKILLSNDGLIRVYVDGILSVLAYIPLFY